MEEYAKERNIFLEKIENGETEIIPPSPFVIEEGTLSDIQEGKEVIIKTEGIDLKGKIEAFATEITIIQ